MGKQAKRTYSTDETAAVFGVTSRTLQLWHQSGCPRVKRGRWDLGAVVLWWAENIYTSCNRADDTPGSDLHTARTAYWQAKAEQMQLSVEKTREQLMPKNDVLTEWTERVLTVCTGLEALADRLPPLLSGLAPKAMMPIIKREVRYLRQAYADRGRYCDVPPKLAKLIDDFYADQDGGDDG